MLKPLVEVTGDQLSVSHSDQGAKRRKAGVFSSVGTLFDFWFPACVHTNKNKNRIHLGCEAKEQQTDICFAFTVLTAPISTNGQL